jgi:antitoxin CptB
MTDDSEDRCRRRLLYRSTHRGTKEADIILGGFARAHLAAMPAGDLARFETLLQESDPDLMAWIGGKTIPPPEYDTDLLRLIVKFKYSLSRP